MQNAALELRASRARAFQRSCTRPRPFQAPDAKAEPRGIEPSRGTRVARRAPKLGRNLAPSLFPTIGPPVRLSRSNEMIRKHKYSLGTVALGVLTAFAVGCGGADATQKENTDDQESAITALAINPLGCAGQFGTATALF